jgi:hypothetical protein
MTDFLRGSKRKIEWAKRNIAKLEEGIDLFFASKPYSVITEVDINSKEVFYKAVLSRAIEVDIEGLVNNIVNDLRSSLDLLTSDTARKHQGVDVPQVIFPFGETENIFEDSRVKRKIKKLPPAAVSAFAGSNLTRLGAILCSMPSMSLTSRTNTDG